MRKLLLLACLATSTVSYADSAAPADAGLVAAGSGSAAPAPGSPTSSQLHDPTSDPAGAYGDLKAAKARWPLLVLVVLVGLTKLLTFAGGKFAFIGKFLTKGKNAMIVAAVGTLAAVAYDSLASGGTWTSALVALVPAALALTSSHAPPAAVAKASA